ncbi:hypothetical protein [Streptomyces sp. NPDC057280]
MTVTIDDDVDFIGKLGTGPAFIPLTRLTNSIMPTPGGPPSAT